MHRIPPIVDQLDQKIAELACMSQILLFIAEHAEEGELPQVRDACASLIYVMTDMLKDSRREVGRLHQISFELANQNDRRTPCG